MDVASPSRLLLIASLPATSATLRMRLFASAWLIRRFIDPDAAFLWLDSPAHGPEDALGFDFDGALLTEIGTVLDSLHAHLSKDSST